MQAVIYYPTFEVLTRNAIDDNGVIAASTFGKDNPDWIQQGIDDGTPNVFYGGLEVWVAPNEESAWMILMMSAALLIHWTGDRPGWHTMVVTTTLLIAMMVQSM